MTHLFVAITTSPGPGPKFGHANWPVVAVSAVGESEAQFKAWVKRSVPLTEAQQRHLHTEPITDVTREDIKAFLGA